jgi:ABC-2 type transport system permease protein
MTVAGSAFRLYLKYLGISVRSQLEYRASFLMFSMGQLLVTAVEFLSMWALFARFGGIGGWTLAEVCMFYGTVNIAFAFGDSISRGFDMFAVMVKSGDFDRILLRPRSTAFQVAGQELTLKRIGRLAQGVAVLAWGAAGLSVPWTAVRIAILAGAIAGGGCLFVGIIVLQATLAFWTTETLEIVNCVTYGGVAAAQYPLPIYRQWFRRFFTYVVPLATVAYFPVIAVIGKQDPLGTPLLFQYLAPLTGVAFLLLSLQAWKLGVRHYRSTGS